MRRVKNRGGYSGKYDVLVDNVKQYLTELAYQLCDGYAVSTGYFSVHPNIGGTFNSDKETHNYKEHPITFRFRTRKPLRSLAQSIAVEILGIADTSGYIAEFIDYDEDSVNTLYIPGDQFALHGHKIKVAGEDPAVGVYFVPVEDPSKAVKVTRMAENTPSKITGIAPKTEHVHNRIEIRTQYAGSGSYLLKTPRIITSGFVLEEA
jgi:hypothetical protein